MLGLFKDLQNTLNVPDLLEDESLQWQWETMRNIYIYIFFSSLSDAKSWHDISPAQLMVTALDSCNTLKQIVA